MGIYDSDHDITRSDMHLIDTAVCKRWLTDDLKPKVVETLKRALESSDDRVSLKAVDILRKLEAQNQTDEHKVVDIGIQKRNAELDAIAADLGIDPRLIVDSRTENDAS